VPLVNQYKVKTVTGTSQEGNAAAHRAAIFTGPGANNGPVVPYAVQPMLSSLPSRSAVM